MRNDINANDGFSIKIACREVGVHTYDVKVPYSADGNTIPETVNLPNKESNRVNQFNYIYQFAIDNSRTFFESIEAHFSLQVEVIAKSVPIALGGTA